MSMADADITDSLMDERVATCLDELIPDIYNAVALGHPLINQLETSPYKEERNGGARIRFPIRYGKYNNVKSFGKGEVRTPSQPALIGFGYNNFKQVAGEWAIDWVEEREQAGSGNVVDLITQRVQFLIEDAREALSTMFWQSSVGNMGKDMNGIPLVLPTDPRTGVYAGFDRATRFWWRNWYWDNSALSYGRHPIDSTAGAPANITAFGSLTNKYSECLHIMGVMMDSIAQNENLGDYMLLTDQFTYEQYVKLAQHMGTFSITYTQDADTVKWGFGNAQFRGMPILFDTIQNGAEAGVIRAINKKYTKLITDSGAWFTWSSERSPYNQFARVRYLMMRGQLVNYAPWKNGILQGITAWA